MRLFSKLVPLLVSNLGFYGGGAINSLKCNFWSNFGKNMQQILYIFIYNEYYLNKITSRGQFRYFDFGVGSVCQTTVECAANQNGRHLSWRTQGLFVDIQNVDIQNVTVKTSIFHNVDVHNVDIS